MSNITKELINNAALLIALCIVYEITYIIPIKRKVPLDVFKGLFAGLIGLAVMVNPFVLDTGIIFDTRSILLSITALIFGPVPALAAVITTAAYRIWLGGAGALMGVSVIVLSASIGLVGHKLIVSARFRCLKIYLMGIAVHIAMLACTFLLPQPSRMVILKEIYMPVMLIYPVGTVLLGLLLFRQKERIEALLQAREAEERYRSIFHNRHVVMLLINPTDGSIKDANPAAALFYGWSVSQIKTMNIADINTLPLDELIKQFDKAIKNECNRFVVKHRRANQPPADVEVFNGPVKNKGKTMVCSVIHDISERTAVTQALLESENRFRLLVENSPDAIFILSGDTFVYLNPASLQLFGADNAAQLTGASFSDRLPPESSGPGNPEQKEPAAPSGEYVFVKMDGTRVYVNATDAPISYNAKDGIIVFARDITERKNLETNKREMEAQLRQQQKMEAIGTLAGGVAHEINNPLNGIMNYAQLILDMKETNARQSDYAKEIIYETERISEIVKNLLRFSRQEKQSHSYASIYDIINHTIQLIKTIIKKDQIELVVTLEEQLPEIKCRSQQIQQVIMNLLTNSRDALNDKYPGYNPAKKIEVKCSAFLHKNEKWIQLSIKDYGTGIPEENMDKLFEPFFSTKPKDRGTGLGLSISYGIVKDHHGKIRVLTRPGQYTEFVVDLPADNGWHL